jgi:hypothetical protein
VSALENFAGLVSVHTVVFLCAVNDSNHCLGAPNLVVLVPILVVDQTV